MSSEYKDIRQWAAHYPFAPIEIDCIRSVMLKILDGKCKMSGQGKQVIEQLYDCTRSRSGQMLGAAEDELIARARSSEPDEALRMEVYERRLLAETMISRPVMKRFKQMLRDEGIIGGGV